MTWPSITSGAYAPLLLGVTPVAEFIHVGTSPTLSCTSPIPTTSAITPSPFLTAGPVLLASLATRLGAHINASATDGEVGPNGADGL